MFFLCLFCINNVKFGKRKKKLKIYFVFKYLIYWDFLQLKIVMLCIISNINFQGFYFIINKVNGLMYILLNCFI